MRRLVPTTLLLIGVSASFAVGCDIFKPKATDAGTDPNATATATATDTNTPATPAAPGPVTPAAPLGPATTPHTTPVKTDGGATVADAGKTDGSAPAAPTIPTIPGFDAGAFKGFDAGALPFKLPDSGLPAWPK